MYAQASFTTNTTNIARDTLKISKEMFPNLKDYKIEQIQKIISNVKKPKPRLNMMMKGLSRKQVIVPISIENVKYFMRVSISRSKKVDLTYFIFLSIFIFFSIYFSIFYF